MYQYKRKVAHIQSSEVCYGALIKLISVSDELSDFLESTRRHVLGHTLLPLGSESKDTEQLPNQFDLVSVGTSAGTINCWKTSYTTEAPTKASPSSQPTSRELSAHTLPASLPLPRAGTPFVNYVNLVLCGLKPGQGRTGVTATILLDNPTGRMTLSLEAFSRNVQCVFGLRGTNIRLYHYSVVTKELSADSDVRCLSQSTIFVYPRVIKGVSQSSLNTSTEPLCRYLNVVSRERTGTLLLENPCGDVVTWKELLAQASVILGMSSKDVRLSRTPYSSGMLCCEDETNLLRLHGTTIFVL